MRVHSALVVSLALSACDGAAPRASAKVHAATEQPGVDAAPMSFANEDRAMGAAMDEGRRTLATFGAALEHPPSGSRDFAVKVGFLIGGDDYEYMWLQDVTPTGDGFQGILTADPVRARGHHGGDRITAKRAEIVDWIYVKDGRMVGGYTLRAMMEATPPEQREAIQRQLGFRIE